MWAQAENQAIDRVHRIGQTHDVTVHKLFMAGSNNNPVKVVCVSVCVSGINLLQQHGIIFRCHVKRLHTRPLLLKDDRLLAVYLPPSGVCPYL